MLRIRLIIDWSLVLIEPFACGAYTAIVYVMTFCGPGRALTSVVLRKRAHSSARLAWTAERPERICAVLPPTLPRSVVASGVPASPPTLGLPFEMKMTKFLAHPSLIGLT